MLLKDSSINARYAWSKLYISIIPVDKTDKNYQRIVEKLWSTGFNMQSIWCLLFHPRRF